MKSFIDDVMPNIAVLGIGCTGEVFVRFDVLTRKGDVSPCFAIIVGIKMLTANKANSTIITCLMKSGIVPTCP